MSEFDIIRAWKDPDYRESLTEEQRSQLPENPAGMIELPDQEMETIQGGRLQITKKGCFRPKLTRIKIMCSLRTKSRDCYITSRFFCIKPTRFFCANTVSGVGCPPIK